MRPYYGSEPRFRLATQLSAKRFLPCAVIRAKERHENVVAERHSIHNR